MAGQERQVRRVAAEQAAVALVQRHVACAGLEGLHVGDAGHLDDGLGRVERLGGERVQVDDDTDVDRLRHALKEPHRRLRLHPEPQPVVRRHQQDAVGAGLLGGLRLLDRLQRPLGRHAGDHQHLAPDLARDHLGDAAALRGRQRGDLARVAVADQSPDLVEAGQPAHVAAQLPFVDRVVVIQGQARRREDVSPSIAHGTYDSRIGADVAPAVPMPRSRRCGPC